MTDYSVRPAVLEDAVGFVRAHERAWDSTIGPIAGQRLDDLAHFEERVARYRTSLANASPDAGVWVAESEGEIVGVAVRSGPELRDLSVVPAAWGTGVALRLMDVALDAIRVDGHEAALLWVGESNARARRFYEREGWHATGDSKVGPLGPTELCYRRSFVSP